MVRRAARDPQALFRWLVPAVVVLSFVPDFFLSGDGGGFGAPARLLMHVAVAAIAVPVYRQVIPLTSV
ncbi:DUF6069 family protein [Streptomyces sp. NPDC058457]|uniref:DUF6069 family protein n=1 Tax=Streptomyces sp. NPDC058457 TaxID=3346507 RepID=UPI00364867BE